MVWDDRSKGNTRIHRDGCRENGLVPILPNWIEPFLAEHLGDFRRWALVCDPELFGRAPFFARGILFELDSPTLDRQVKILMPFTNSQRKDSIRTSRSFSVPLKLT